MKKTLIKLRIIQILLIALMVFEFASSYTWDILRETVDFSKHESLGILLDKLYYIPLFGAIPTFMAMLILPSISYKINREKYST